MGFIQKSLFSNEFCIKCFHAARYHDWNDIDPDDLPDEPPPCNVNGCRCRMLEIAAGDNK